MSVVGASHGPVNGTGPLSPNLHETQEYEKILKLRDQIFAGEHPRLNVPKHLIRKPTPRSTQTPTVPAAVESSAAPQTKVHPLSSSTLQEQSPSISAVPTPVAAAPVTSSDSPGGHVGATKPTSEIDPIFLTKSDDLIRAEIQLQRERVERALRNQLDQKRLEYRQKTSLQESQPEFDVADVLAKALEVVKPASIPDVEGPNVNASASDSFDENSFYSSKAPDSPQHGDHHEHSPIQDHRVRPVDVDQPYGGSHVDHRNMEAQQHKTGHRGQVDLDMQASPYNIADKRGPLSRSPENIPYAPPSPSHYRPREHPDLYEEPEYSPPEPEYPPNGRIEEGEYVPESEPTYRRRSNGKPAGRGRGQPRNVSPLRDGRVIRNHITSPAAPQPSRVSPLAVNKVASLPQGRHARQHRYTDVAQPNASGRASPEGPLQPLTSRKRRRVQERPGVDAERTVNSPDMPYIKPEPVSPPPFSDLPTHGSMRRAHPYDIQTLIDIDSPRHSPAPRGMVYEDRYARRYDALGHGDYEIPRSSSRIAYRRPPRDDQDLRRVVSLQHVRKPEYGHDYPEPPMNYSPRTTRAASYVVPDRVPQADRSRYYEEPPQPYDRRYVPQDVEPTSPRFRESYAEFDPEPRVMGPPPRRVVVDAEGNRYVESVAASKMPPPSSRLSRVDPYYDEPHLQNGSMRAASVMEEPYRERRYVQEMPPPAVTYRRAPEYSRAVMGERPYYEREIDERAPPIRAGSVAVASYPRQATYVEEAPMPPRMSSVRPPPARYEEQPREAPVQRLHSVRPSGAGREVSIFVDDDRPRHRREYAPVERASGYGTIRPMREERFYDEDEPSKFGMDLMHEVVPRRY